MQRVVQPYLFFEGHCEEALEFYKHALGAHVLFQMRFKEAPEQPPSGTNPPNWGEKIMHASFQIGETTLMASDGCSSATPKFEGFSLSLAVSTEAEAEKLFTALSEGGQVRAPLTRTFFSPRFGMVQDKFGIGWMVMVRSAGQ